MVDVREMTGADVQAVSRVRVLGWRAAYAGLVPQPYLDGMSVEDDARQRRAWMSDPRRQGSDLVADAGAGPVGWVSVGPYRGATPESRVGEVYALYVRPDLIGQGIGRALLDTAHACAKARGFGTVALWVLGGNEGARRFYEKAGYVADGEEQSDTYDDVELTELRYTRSI
ncbi:GNAT family N-acetyltransferase [Streptomyces sp. NPDC006632]|uniref:GNAT family N-acetyltransferase n=1 Tax=Streptomyces sp. NPDC006632 TaxID=3157182 RepID=UPI0033A0D633